MPPQEACPICLKTGVECGLGHESLHFLGQQEVTYFKFTLQISKGERVRA